MKPNKTPRKHAAFASSSRQMKRRPKVKSLLAVLVAFCTVCALTMPAATLEGQAQASCGLAEHTHDESCYESVLVCGQEESEGHVHDESCYEEVLTCEIPEHTHSEACWAQPETQAEAGNEENSEAVTGDGAGSDMEADAGTETGTDTEADTGTGTGTDSSENGDAAEAGSETDSSGNAGTGAGDTGSAESGAESGDGQTGDGGAGSEADGTAENGSGTENAGEQGESTSTEDALTEADKTEQAENPQASEEAAEMPDGATVPEGYTEQYTVRDEENGFAVTVYAPEGVVPEGAVLSAELLSEETEEYAAAEQELAAETEAVMAENGVSALSEDGADAASEDGEAAAPSYGFAALDIHFEYENGEEVEPNGDVYVVIDAAGLLPEDADPESVTVQHHAEQEDGSVAVETVADTADATNGVVAVVENEAQAENDVQAAFEVDGFSTFTITWSGRRTTYFQVTVHYVDASGTEIQGTRRTDLTGGAGNTYTFSDYAGVISGYTYSGAHYHSYSGTTVTSMRFTSSNGWFGTTRSLTFYNGNDAISNGTLTYNNNTVYADVYLVYTTNTPEGFYIEETISEDGRFTAAFSEGTEPVLSDGQYIQYTWTRGLDQNSIDTEVAYTKVTGDSYNMAAENGTKDSIWVNVALDSDVVNASSDQRYWYQVIAQVMNADGTPVEEKVYTASLQVPYYIQLQNGSFENPNIEEYTHSDSSHQWQFSNGTEGLIWQSTGTAIAPDGGSQAGQEVAIEILRTETEQESENAQTYHNCGAADDGVQYAELNCEAYGALYQEVMTVPGATLNWYFAHLPREVQNKWTGRTGDTMALVIMPSSSAQEYIERLTDASKDSDTIRTILNEIEERGEENGYFVQMETSNYQYKEDGTRFGEHEANAWNHYSGTYTVGENQYLTTFFFVAVDTGSTASNSETIGNLLDNVYFTSEPVPATPDTANLTVTKKVEGLGLNDSENEYCTVIVVVKEGDADVDRHTFDIDDFDANGEASHTFRITGITAGGSKTLTVTETATTVEGYTVTQTYKIGEGDSAQGTEATLTVEGEENYTVAFTNTYTQTTGSLTIKKAVTGVEEDNITSRSYIFTVTAGSNVDAAKLPESFADGSTTVTITGAASETLTGLPAGTYTVVEQGSSQGDIIVGGEKYQFEEVVYSGGSGTGKNEASVSAGGTAEITATNSYRQVVDIVIKKIDGNGNDLAGAEFQLTNTDGKYYVYDQVTGTRWNDVDTTFDADNEGGNIFSLHDLPDGTYTLTETKAPDGYQLLTSNITITVNGGEVHVNGAGAEYENGIITVPNITGTELPETGGPGTTILTIGGLLLMAGAVGGGYGLRRRRGKEGR